VLFVAGERRIGGRQFDLHGSDCKKDELVIQGGGAEELHPHTLSFAALLRSAKPACLTLPGTGSRATLRLP